MGVASGGTGTILDLEGDRGGERGAGEEDHTEEVRDEVSHSYTCIFRLWDACVHDYSLGMLGYTLHFFNCLCTDVN